MTNSTMTTNEPQFIAAYRYPYAISEWDAVVDALTLEVNGTRKDEPQQASSQSARIDIGNSEELYLGLTPWHPISTSLVDLSYVLLIRHEPGKPETAQYWYISISDMPAYPNEVKLSSIHKQLLKFWEDSKLPAEDRQYKLPASGNFGAWEGGVAQVPCNYEKGDWLE
jgi:hypothetical protein